MAKQSKRMGPKRRRKTPGVRLLSSQAGGVPPRIEYRDPDNGKTIREAIPAGPVAEHRRRDRKGHTHSLGMFTKPVGGRATLAERTEYAAEVARLVERRRKALEDGAPGASQTSIKAARDIWADSANTESTRTARKVSTTAFLAWAEAEGIETFDRFRYEHQAAFHDHLASLDLAHSTKNKDQDAAANFLRWAVRRRKVPSMKSPNEVYFERFNPGESEPEPLDRKGIRKQIDAAKRLDKDVGGHKALRLIVIGLLLGARRKALGNVPLDDFDPQAIDEEGRTVGTLEIRSAFAKNGEARTVFLDYSPGLRRLLAHLKLAEPKGAIVSGSDYREIGNIMRRLHKTYGAPTAKIHDLRDTCVSWMWSSPGLWPSSIADEEACDRVGHLYKQGKKFYVKRFKGVSRDATTLEASMQIEDVIDELIAAFGSAPSKSSCRTATKRTA